LLLKFSAFKTAEKEHKSPAQHGRIKIASNLIKRQIYVTKLPYIQIIILVGFQQDSQFHVTQEISGGGLCCSLYSNEGRETVQSEGRAGCCVRFLIGCEGLLQFSHWDCVQEHWSREAYDMRATLQKLKFLQLDSGKEQDNTVFVSAFSCLRLRCGRL